MIVASNVPRSIEQFDPDLDVVVDLDRPGLRGTFDVPPVRCAVTESVGPEHGPGGVDLDHDPPSVTPS